MPCSHEAVIPVEGMKSARGNTENLEQGRWVRALLGNRAGQAMSATMSTLGGQGKLLCSHDLEQRPPWCEQHESLRMSIPGRRTSMRKGPEARMGSVCLMKSKEANTAEAEWQELGKRRSRGLKPSPQATTAVLDFICVRGEPAGFEHKSNMLKNGWRGIYSSPRVARTDYPKLGGLKQRTFISPVPDARSPKSRRQQDWTPLEAPVQASLLASGGFP